MKPIYVFYHVYQVNNWHQTFINQINNLVVSGLYKFATTIYIYINGSDPLPVNLDKFFVVYNDKLLDHGECPTLIELHKFSTFNDSNILYIHTKGVSYSSDSSRKLNTEFWRLYMEYFVVNNWQKCVGLLDMYDCVGTEWSNTKIEVKENSLVFFEDECGYFKGNFWWANAKYLRKLDVKKLIIKQSVSANQHNLDWLKRTLSEFFIGTGNPRYFNFYNIGHCLYESNDYFPLSYIEAETLRSFND